MAIKNIPDVYASNKILDTNEAKRKISEIKSKNKTVGLCHGGFDLLHSGHIKHFESAKKICDYLFVSVTSDRFVSLLKGKVRPIFPDKLRAYSIASIQFVDYVLIADFKLGVEVINILIDQALKEGMAMPDQLRRDANQRGKRVAALIVTALSAPFEVNGTMVNISASVGVAIYPGGAQNATELLSQADRAMYVAKAQGRGCYRMAD